MNDKQRRRAQRAAKRARQRQRLGDRVAVPRPKIPAHLVTDWDIVNPGQARPVEDYTYDVEVFRNLPDDPNDPEDVAGWSAEGGMRGDGAGVTFDWSPLLAELVEHVMDEVARWRTRFPDLPVTWRLVDSDEASDLSELAAREGVQLPR